MNPLTIRIDPPELLDELVSAFRRNGCPAWRIGARSCSVDHAAAADEQEARLEVAFFLRAWQAQHGYPQATLVAG